MISFHRFDAVSIGFPADDVIDAEADVSGSESGLGQGSGSGSEVGSGWDV